MKKDLIIQMEEECVECPMLSLITNDSYAYNLVAHRSFECEHLEFCKIVRQNWERVWNEKKYVHGHWIDESYYLDNQLVPRFQCSECEFQWGAMSKYCPNCGAKMDEVKDDGQDD